MKFRLLLAVAAAASALLAGGCSSGPAEPSGPGASPTIPLLRVGTAAQVTTVDPTKPGSPSWTTALSLETLLQFGPKGQLEPDLATSWTQASPVSWVYHLRHGVRFWDGHPLTAADVAYSLNYERATASQNSWAYPTVKSVAASGAYTVVVTLTHPDASWQYTPATYTAEIFEKSFALAQATRHPRSTR